jgi:hypothetical protein
VRIEEKAGRKENRVKVTYFIRRAGKSGEIRIFQVRWNYKGLRKRKYVGLKKK